MSKPWHREGNSGRRVEITRYIRDRILILCEGKKTEPNYFRKFPVNIELVEIDVDGVGANTLSLVEEATRRGQEAASSGHPYNQIWCVFDRDSFPAGKFNQAFKAAQKNRVRIAYSNQCFELWYFLHYYFIDAALNRDDYALKLTEVMGREYKKNDEEMYVLLKGRQSTAIRNAKTLISRYIICNPEKDNPSTTVYDLVETLNQFLSNNNS